MGKFKYTGDNGVDVVKQNQKYQYYDIFTYGGNDRISLTLNKTHVEAGSGNDTVTSKIEDNNDIFLGKGNDTYTGTGFAHNGRYDIVSGGQGQDTFNVSTRHSDYYGDGGNDTFNAVGYFNNFYGGNGVDTISYLRQDDDSFLSGRGVRIDLFHEQAITGGGRKEHLVGIENAAGTSYADDVIGDNGANTLWGNNGSDLLDGRGGKDILYGGNGADKLYGGGKADMLTGGKGMDILIGGSGADHFIFTSITDSVVGSNRDVIRDFSRSQGDLIDLSAIDANSNSGGNDAFDFIGASGFSNTAGELRFNNGILSGDVDGDGKADFSIKIHDIGNMAASDFIL